MGFNVAITVCLGWVAYQDFRWRAVHLWLFVLLGALLLGLNLSMQPLNQIYPQLVLNTGFLCLQLLVLKLYFRLKSGSWQLLMDHKLGWGDLALLIGVGMYLPFLTFFVFYVVSTFLVLLFTLTLPKWRDPERGIPLAGCQALFFGGCFLLQRTGIWNWDGMLERWLT